MQRDSIFFSSLRLFFSSFSAVIGICLAALFFFIILTMFSTSTVTPEKSKVLILPDAYGNRQILSESSPALVRLNITGIIGSGDLTSEKFDHLLLDSQEGLLRHHRAKGILLYIDSPGGTVTDSAAIYRAVMHYKRKYKIPVFAYVEGLCASGGYYIAAAADKIFANPSAVIGSVGVILGPHFNVTQAMETIGVQALTLTEGKDKDMLNPFRPWKPGEDLSLRNVMEGLYIQFVNVVTTDRQSLNRDKLINEYGAQVFIAETAQKLGYIDEAQSSYREALDFLAQQSGIAKEEKYQVFQLSPPSPLFSEMFQNAFRQFSNSLYPLIPSTAVQPELKGKFLYLYTS